MAALGASAPACAAAAGVVRQPQGAAPAARAVAAARRGGAARVRAVRGVFGGDATAVAAASLRVRSRAPSRRVLCAAAAAPPSTGAPKGLFAGAHTQRVLPAPSWHAPPRQPLPRAACTHAVPPKRCAASSHWGHARRACC
jgi:hypothetical protein